MGSPAPQLGLGFVRIAINGYFLQQTATGSGEHLYYLLEGLGRVDQSGNYLVLCPRLTRSRILRVPPIGPNFEIREIRGTSARLGARLGKLWWEQVTLKRQCEAEKVDLLHSPYFASPLSPNVPTVVTVHDVIPLILPAYGSAVHTRLYMRLVSAAARRARAIITVSGTSKKDIARVLGIPEDRIHVVYNAVDRALHPVDDQRILTGVREAHGIVDDFLLYFGGFDIRKNVERIIRAYHLARSSFDRPWQLVIAGAMHLVGHPLYPDPRPVIQELGLQGQVVVTGRISEEEKPLLYSAATAFIFPSLYEGFGLPVLEAMACGTPVITSNLSSLPEVAGDAALLVEPSSVEDMAQAMTRLMNDAALREELRGRGLRRVRQFDWEASAARTLDIYRQALL
jgi:glycosyltransferase involved in cell wall biosynthesis